ncbi:hypothetical protein E2C01_025150 [Portunus trituberculatus]|uniref:Uncharacterized protein n=1 Tax=Portunus trituberculatus TaxID=210409 RepID=A0A5B7EC81_PORTR|nr:hypothetical protein [Portunus trituberculatus]
MNLSHLPYPLLPHSHCLVRSLVTFAPSLTLQADWFLPSPASLPAGLRYCGCGTVGMFTLRGTDSCGVVVTR